jgi:hypothetical protein
LSLHCWPFSCNQYAPVSDPMLLAKAPAFFLLTRARPIAETTDATKSIGTPVATIVAGVATSFTITAKDESGSLRTSGGDAFNVELEGTRSITGSVVDGLDGKYTVSYTATQSGSYEAAVKLAQGIASALFPILPSANSRCRPFPPQLVD